MTSTLRRLLSGAQATRGDDAGATPVGTPRMVSAVSLSDFSMGAALDAAELGEWWCMPWAGAGVSGARVWPRKAVFLLWLVPRSRARGAASGRGQAYPKAKKKAFTPSPPPSTHRHARFHHPLPRRLPGPGRPPVPGLVPVVRAVVHGGGALPRRLPAHERERERWRGARRPLHAVAVVHGLGAAR